jgi:hypothetical protein
MAHETLLTIFVILTALALAAQAAVLVGLYIAMRDIPRQIEDIRRSVKDRLDPLADLVREILAGSREPVRAATSNVVEISEVLRARTASVDLLLAEVLEKSRAQIIRIDQLITSLTHKVETTADAVERQVMVPVAEISALAAGVRSGLRVLFSSKPRQRASGEVAHDEELFI